MLETLHSSLFMPHIGKPCRLICGEVTIDAVLDGARDNPHARAHESDDSRMPFTLLFRGQPNCPYAGGTFTLQIDGMADIPGVYVNRVMNSGPEPGSLFQVVFS